MTGLIGLLGGMSWESSALYYRLLNTGMQRRLGGHHNARSVLFTLDFDELNSAAAADRWEIVGEKLGAAARSVEAAGADFVMITAVTGHAVAAEVAAMTSVPLLHIADTTGQAIRAAGFSKVGLLATRYTMEKPFFVDSLREQHGIEAIVPETQERLALHRIIVDELTMGNVTSAARDTYLSLVEQLAQRGAQAIVIGCTELPLLLAAEDHPIPAFDVVRLHVGAAIDRALEAGSHLTRS